MTKIPSGSCLILVLCKSAKAYKEKVAEPLRKMLVNLVRPLTIKCVNQVRDMKNLKERYDRVSAEVITLRKKNKDLKVAILY